MANRLSAGMKFLARKNRKQMTGPEIKLWYELKDFKRVGAHFRKQAPMGQYIVDFVCHGKKLVIELDGDSHSDAVQMRKDKIRDDWLRAEGYRVMRIFNDEVYNNLDAVLDEIYRHLNSYSHHSHPTPNPSPSRGGEEPALVPHSPSRGGEEPASTLRSPSRGGEEPVSTLRSPSRGEEEPSSILPSPSWGGIEGGGSFENNPQAGSLKTAIKKRKLSNG